MEYFFVCNTVEDKNLNGWSYDDFHGIEKNFFKKGEQLTLGFRIGTRNNPAKLVQIILKNNKGEVKRCWDECVNSKIIFYYESFESTNLDSGEYSVEYFIDGKKKGPLKFNLLDTTVFQ